MHLTMSFSKCETFCSGLNVLNFPAPDLYICWTQNWHYNDVIMSAMGSQITSLMIVLSSVYSDADQRKHQSSMSLAFVQGIRQLPVNSPHKRQVMRKMFPFDDIIMVITKPADIPPHKGQHWGQCWMFSFEMSSTQVSVIIMISNNLGHLLLTWLKWDCDKITTIIFCGMTLLMNALTSIWV